MLCAMTYTVTHVPELCTCNTHQKVHVHHQKTTRELASADTHLRTLIRWNNGPPCFVYAPVEFSPAVTPAPEPWWQDL